MTLEEAIKGIKEVLGLDCHIKYKEWTEALNLGIEALEVFAEYRYATGTDVLELLPGETKE